MLTCFFGGLLDPRRRGTVDVSVSWCPERMRSTNYRPL